MTPDIPQKKIQYTRFEYIVNLLKTEVNGGYIVEPITCHNNWRNGNSLRTLGV